MTTKGGNMQEKNVSNAFSDTSSTHGEDAEKEMQKKDAEQGCSMSDAYLAFAWAHVKVITTKNIVQQAV